jgi:hypothetical protein
VQARVEQRGRDAVGRARFGDPDRPGQRDERVAVAPYDALDRAQPRAVESRDLVLLDAPVAARVLRSPNLLGGFDGVLLVVHASRTPKTVARETKDDLLEAGANLLGVVLNGCS